jgi:FkbM family methyltransferase
MLRQIAARVAPTGSVRRRIVAPLARLVDPRPASRLRRWAAGRDNVCFVQIGSQDGRRLDPLHRYLDERSWRGVLVEPMPAHFERLTTLRGGDPRFTLLPFAVSHHPGTMTMYTVDPAENDPAWVSGCSSLHRHVIAGHDSLVPGLANRIREEQVEVVCLADVLERAALPRVDLLHIDTEGHDAVILDQIDACGLRPAVIQYEHKHLSPADAERCRRRLEQCGYRLTRDTIDTLAIRFWPSVALRMRPSFGVALRAFLRLSRRAGELISR